ncbi:MAG: hypothetical protein R2873_13315 [Caldilineaceae bacterium]
MRPTTQIPSADALVTGEKRLAYPLFDTNSAEEWTIYKPGEQTPRRA